MNQKTEKVMGKIVELTEEEGKYVLPKQFTGTDEQYNNILRSLKSHLLFRQLEEDALKNVTSAMIQLVVEKDDTIINQGEVGDNFFVVYEGSFDVYVVREGDVMEKVHTYQAFPGIYPSFGELALLYDKPRSATVIAQTNGILFALDRESFRTTVLKNTGLEYLRSLPFLSSLSIEKLKEVYGNCKEMSFEKDEIIYDDMIEIDYFFVVLSGSVKYKDSNQVYLYIYFRDAILTAYSIFGKGIYKNVQTYIANTKCKCLQIKNSFMKLIKVFYYL